MREVSLSAMDVDLACLRIYQSVGLFLLLTYSTYLFLFFGVFVLPLFTWLFFCLGVVENCREFK